MDVADSIEAEGDPEEFQQRIIEEARELKAAYDATKREAARRIVLRNVHNTAAFYAEQRALRDEYLAENETEREGNEGSAGQSCVGHEKPASPANDDLQVVSVKRTTTAFDISLERLDRIREMRAHGGVHVVMPDVNKLPRFNAWVPVVQNQFVTEPDCGVYVPWFGDDAESLKKAAEVYEMMQDDAEFESAFNEPSDGEINEVGELKEKKDPSNYTLDSMLGRAAIRHVVVEITTRHGKPYVIWAALANALKVDDIRRLLHMCDLAERRNAEKQKKLEDRKTSLRHKKSIEKAVYRRNAECFRQQGRDGNATNPLRFFCFFCHEFACHFHAGDSVAPVIPIPDRKAEQRNLHFGRSKGKIEPCSMKCYLLEKWRQVPTLPEEGQTWSATELALLDEGAAMFLRDPCGISQIIGTKTCREVNERIRGPQEVVRINELICRVKAPRDPPPANAGPDGRTPQEDTRDLVSAKQKRGRRLRYRRRLKSACTVPEKKSSPTQDEERFVPCNHAGICTKRNGCRCALKGLECQSVCGCNSGRFVEGKEGIFWLGPTEEATDRLDGKRCKLRVQGCDCKDGYCNTANCDCHQARRICNPDYCNSCECNVLPSQADFRMRRCRNADLITGRHKKTFVGRSSVHGFGLFAGEYFWHGDLIGPYCGRLMENDLMDRALRVPQAIRETFAFQVVKGMAIDGGVVGSKAKFINHQEGKEVNCEARTERYRGEARIALKAKRQISPGEELFFNYAIIDEGGDGNNWLMGDKRKKSRRQGSSRGTNDADEENRASSDEEGSSSKSSSSSDDEYFAAF